MTLARASSIFNYCKQGNRTPSGAALAFLKGMKTRIAQFCLAAILATGYGFAQTAKQDMKNAGSETKNAAKDTGKGIGHATKTNARKVKHKTKSTVHKASSKVANKTSDHN
jgi:hypothetical protein